MTRSEHASASRRPRVGLVTATGGAAAVEFAMVALVMLMLMFGIMEFARAYWTREILAEVSTEGARCVALLASGCASGGAYSSTAANNYIIGVASARGLTLTSAAITVTRPATCAGTSGFSQVSLTYTFSTSASGLLPSLASLPLSASACYYNVR